MIELYNDSKNRVFTLNLDIEGYEPKDVEIKMFIQFKKYKRIYVFFAEYNKTDNNYIIDIPTLEEIDQDSGKLWIEVIAGDMFYKAHEDEFTVDVKKKVEVKKINSTVNEKPKAKIDFSLKRENDEDDEDEVLVKHEEGGDDDDEEMDDEFNYEEETDEESEDMDDYNFDEEDEKSEEDEEGDESEEDDEESENGDDEETDEDGVINETEKMNEKMDKIFDKTFKKDNNKKLNEKNTNKPYNNLIKKFSNFR
jgi:cobalamin biosynthesis protein CobT